MGSVSWQLDSDALTLRYWRHDAEGELRQHLDRLPLRTTPAGFGGARQWLSCPCGRRCRVVYVQSHGARCRKCYRLGYQSQREHASTRAMTRASKLAQRLGAARDDPYDWVPPKPKGMHWRTYWRIDGQHSEALRALDAGLMSKLLADFA